MKTIVSYYEMNTGRLPCPLLFAVVSDLHDCPWEWILPHLEGADALLIPGDLADRYHDRYENSVLFLKEAVRRLPVFVSLGNHDLSMKPFRDYFRALSDTGACLLCEDWREFRGVAIAGRYRQEKRESIYSLVKKSPKRIAQFEKLSIPKILLCHKPEQFARLGEGHPVDLTVSGHAHGGQIRIFGRGVFSPGQGILPKLTHGMEKSGLLVTSGVGNPVGAPRWGNPLEVVLLSFS